MQNSLKSLCVTTALVALSPLHPLVSHAQTMTTVAKPLSSNPNTAAKETADPRAFLDEIDGAEAMKWVLAHNQTTLDRLSKDPRFAQSQAEALAILQATDRIAYPSFAHKGMVQNFWQDADHVHGIWRQTTWDSYKTATPAWDTILDIDALSKAEGKNWVYEGADCLAPDYTRCLISLSDGGKDATVIREFDITTKSFIAGGFDLPEGKQSVSWRDADTVYVTREWTPGDVTASSYAYITKALKRGQSLDQATEIFRGTKADVSAGRYVLRNIDGSYVMDMSYRGIDFFHTEQRFYVDGKAIALPLPTSSSFAGYMQGQAIYTLKEDWTSAGGKTFKTGAVLVFDLKNALTKPAALEPTLLFQPDAHQSVEGLSQTRNRLVLNLLNNVTSEVWSYQYSGGKWSSKKLDLPSNSAIAVTSADDQSDRVLVSVSSFLIPATLVMVDAASGTSETLKSSPARFNADGLQVQQFWAKSKDGTQVPYFLVARKDIALDGTTPVILNAYGGFEVSMTPSYSGTIGKLWLEKGGAYVLANIRGGGEFGPAWHEAGLKTKRQNIYNDFQAVAEDLIARKITTPRHLGIMGGSNGGLLMGVQLTQRPDLWNAVDVQVPLLDMVNYTHMSAGASWQGEYGDPNDPVEGAFLRSISPYHNVKAGVAYPEPLFETSTKDDRVGPVHARKMAALFEEMGLPFFYYENTEGGHAAASNLPERARRYAIDYTYFMQKLMDK
ncbi:prolyl oligopeptidase family serine peptidase [Asticcacaulis sp. 201]|nr:prolyl oligopeptidase family serine peptidase [Asticcacaulis sp. 201]MDV6332231.1 prolyl oligopeptidase family serine peptidase [Asticcacaulis sp. 201]